MSGPGMLVGLGATKAPWSGELRGFVRDHVTGMEAVTVLDAAQLARVGKRRFDVFVLDDVTRVFTAAEVGREVEAGTVVIGLYGAEGGLGRGYLDGLGVSRMVPVDVGVAELVEVLAEIGPRREWPPPFPPGAELPNPFIDQRITPAPPARSTGPGRRAALVVCSSVSEGVGGTETVIALAERWAQHEQVLVVEAHPTVAVLAARLRRDGYYGVAWALGRLAHGQCALPTGLSPALVDLGPRLGRFDVICGTSTPAGPAFVDPVHLGLLVDEATGRYDRLVVRVGGLFGGSGRETGDRFAAGRAMLARADRVVVFAGADPEAVGRLVEWRAAAAELGVTAPIHAVFGRVPRSRFEWAHLVDLLETSSGPSRFERLWRLPEDPVVGRARWNGELVWRGKWLAVIARLAAELARAVPSGEPEPAVRVGAGRPVSLAGEVGW